MGYSRMVIMTALTAAYGRSVERAIIAGVKHRPGCMNRAPGGERIGSDEMMPFFIYVCTSDQIFVS